MGPDILHKHMIVRAEVKSPLSDPTDVTNWLRELVEKLDMKILMGPFAEYCPKCGNEGATGIVVIETSHIAIHIWDACNPAILQMDVYTCGELHEEVVFEHLQVMNPTKIEWKYLDRMSRLHVVSTGESTYDR
jgi:S-adenosylmethionine/arginine decarboxylase-like enzyme